MAGFNLWEDQVMRDYYGLNDDDRYDADYIEPEDYPDDIEEV